MLGRVVCVALLPLYHTVSPRASKMHNELVPNAGTAFQSHQARQALACCQAHIRNRSGLRKDASYSISHLQEYRRVAGASKLLSEQSKFEVCCQVLAMPVIAFCATLIIFFYNAPAGTPVVQQTHQTLRPSRHELLCHHPLPGLPGWLRHVVAALFSGKFAGSAYKEET